MINLNSISTYFVLINEKIAFFIEAANHYSVEVIKFLLSFGKQYNKTMCTATLR